MNVKRHTDVTTEPLTETIIKNYIKYSDTNTTEVALINSMAKAARKAIEERYSLALAAQTLICYIQQSDIYDDKFILPRFPHKGYVANEFLVYAVDYEGTETALVKNTGYYLAGQAANELEINFNTVTTVVGLNTDYCDYKVQYIAGYGISSYTEALPDDLIVAMAKLVAEWYHNRGSWLPVISDYSEVHRLCLPYSRNVGF